MMRFTDKFRLYTYPNGDKGRRIWEDVAWYGLDYLALFVVGTILLLIFG
jgi:hypothetical protein